MNFPRPPRLFCWSRLLSGNSWRRRWWHLAISPLWWSGDLWFLFLWLWPNLYFSSFDLGCRLFSSRRSITIKLLPWSFQSLFHIARDFFSFVRNFLSLGFCCCPKCVEFWCLPFTTILNLFNFFCLLSSLRCTFLLFTYCLLSLVFFPFPIVLCILFSPKLCFFFLSFTVLSFQFNWFLLNFLKSWLECICRIFSNFLLLSAIFLFSLTLFLLLVITLMRLF